MLNAGFVKWVPKPITIVRKIDANWARLFYFFSIKLKDKYFSAEIIYHKIIFVRKSQIHIACNLVTSHNLGCGQYDLMAGSDCLKYIVVIIF